MITVNWADPEKTLLVWHFGNSWSRADFIPACYESQRMVAEVDHGVQVLVDLSLCQTSPDNVVNLALSGMKMYTSTVEQIVVITRTHLWLRLFQYIARVYPIQIAPIEFVNSYRDAMAFLQRPHHEHDTQIDSEPLPAYIGKDVSPFV